MSNSIFPLVLEDLAYAVGERALLQGITAEIEAGLRTVILGPNGAGKSLLLRLCHGLLAPSRGRVEWHARTASQARRDQAMVFQRPVMLRRSAAGNVAYALAMRGVGRSARRLRTDEMLARTGLTAKARVSARVLSGVEDVILEIQSSGTKIIMTTHDLGQARRLGQEILFLCDGRLVERNPTDRFFASPQSPEAAAFIEGRLTW